MRGQRGLGTLRRRALIAADEPVLLPSEGLWERLAMEDEVEREARTPFLDWSMRIPEPKTGTLDFARWPFQRELYDEGMEDHELVVQKGTQVGCCVGPSTKVLLADLTWVRADALQPGDRLVSVDEEHGGRLEPRRLREAELEGIRRVTRKCARLRFADGRAVVASLEHRWLTIDSQGCARWREVQQLRPGQVIRSLWAQPWGQPGHEDGWMAGVLDGEGSLDVTRLHRRITIAQQMNAVYDGALAYLTSRDYCVNQYQTSQPEGRPDVGKLVVSRVAQMMRLLGSVQPKRWREPWWDGVRVPSGDGGSHAVIESIEYLGDREVIDLQTSTKTFIAEGLVSHNSTYLIRWAMYWPDMKGLTALYVFPKKVQLRDFSQGRIRPLIRGTEYLQGRVPRDHIDNAMMRQVGLGLIYFRGSEVKDDLDSVDADVLAFDEYDRLNQDNIEDAEHRVDASPLGLLRRVGNPTIDDFGIAKAYERSDKRQWLVKCGSCNLRQPIDFYENVDFKRALIVCRKCTKRLDVRQGEWVAEYPERSTRGYHISRLIVPGVNLPKIIANSEKREDHAVQTFWNKDLGLPFSPKEGRLSREALAAAQSAGGMYTTEPGHIADGSLVTAGIDVASVRNLHVRISLHLPSADGRTRKRALYLGEAESFDTVQTLLERYSVNMAVIDHLPEHRLALALAERLPGRVYLALFATGQKDVLAFDPDMRRVSVRRVEAMDATSEMIRSQRNLLPADWPEAYVSHMRAPVRVVEKDEAGRKVVRYVSTGPDDYYMAETYDVLATEVWHMVQEVEQATAEELRPLDSMLEFQRSQVEDLESMDYEAGPDPDIGPDW